MGINIEDLLKKAESVTGYKSAVPEPAESVKRVARYKPLARTTGNKEYDAYYEQYGKELDVDPNLLWAQGHQESSFNPNARSNKGAAGIAQFIGDTAKEFGVNVNDPASSIRGQAKLMRQLLDRTGDIDLSLAGYNSGHNLSPEALRRNLKNIRETRDYRDRIRKNYDSTPSAPENDLGDLLAQAKKITSHSQPANDFDTLLSQARAITGTAKAPVPESSDTIAAQIQSALDPSQMERSAVLLTEPNQIKDISENVLPQMVQVKTPNGTVLVSKVKASKLGLNSPYAVNQYVKKNGFAKLIGKVEDVGNATNEGMAVQTVDPISAEEISSSVVTSPDSAQAQIQSDAQQFPGAVSQVVPVQQAIQRREAIKAPQQSAQAPPVSGVSESPTSQPSSQSYQIAVNPNKPEGVSAKSWYLDQDATDLAQRSGVDFETAREFVEQKGYSQTGTNRPYTDEDFERAYASNQPLTANTQAVSEVQAYATNKKASRDTASRQMDRSRQDYLAQGLDDYEAEIFAAKDAGLISGEKFESEIQQYRYERENIVNQTEGQRGFYDTAYSGVSVDPNSGFDPATATDDALASLQESKLKDLREGIARYGSAQKYRSEENRIQREYGTNVLKAPLEAAKRIGLYALKVPGTLLKAGAVAQEANPVTTVIDYLAGTDASKASNNPIFQVGNEVNKKLDTFKNNDFRNDFIVNDLSEAVAQIATQTILAPVTGGASLALPLAEAGVSQYEAADKAGAGRGTRLLATTVGALAAVPDALLKAKYVRFLSPSQKGNFITNFANRLFGGLAKEVGEAEARELTRVTLLGAMKKGAFGFGGEFTEEAAEDVINKTTARLTYNPNQEILPTSEDFRGYAAAGLAGLFGAGVETASENEAVDQAQRDSLYANEPVPAQSPITPESVSSSEIPNNSQENLVSSPTLVRDNKGNQYTVLETLPNGQLRVQNVETQGITNIKPEKVMEVTESDLLSNKETPSLQGESEVAPENSTLLSNENRTGKKKLQVARTESSRTDASTAKSARDGWTAHAEALADFAESDTQINEPQQPLVSGTSENQPSVTPKGEVVGEAVAEKVKKPKAQKLKSLSQFVRSNGGVKTTKWDAGEGRRLSNRETRTSGLINNKSGMSAEIMAGRAWDEGYLRDIFPERSDVNGNDFLDYVESDLHGDRKSFSTADSENFDKLLEQQENEYYESIARDEARQAQYIADRDDLVNKQASILTDPELQESLAKLAQGSYSVDELGIGKNDESNKLQDALTKAGIDQRFANDIIEAYADQTALDEDESVRTGETSDDSAQAFDDDFDFGENLSKPKPVQTAKPQPKADVSAPVRRAKPMAKRVAEDVALKSAVVPSEKTLFYELLSNPIQASENLAREYGFTRLNLSRKSPQSLWLQYAEASKPKTGSLTRFITDLTAWADSVGQSISLTPTNAYGTPVEAILPLYKRFGFKPDNTRKGDLYRVPDTSLKRARTDDTLLTDLQTQHTEDLLPNLSGGKDVDGNLELNEHDSEQVRRLLAEDAFIRTGKEANETSFDGITFSATKLRRLSAIGRSFLASYSELGYSQSEINTYKKLLDNLDALADSAKDFGIIYVYDDALPEERLHQEDLRAGRTDKESLAALKASPFWKSSEQFAREYPGVDAQDKASEIAAKLATDQAEKYGWTDIDNFEQAKAEFLNNWADGILRNNDVTTEEDFNNFIERFERIGQYATNPATRANENTKGNTGVSEGADRQSQRAQNNPDSEANAQESIAKTDEVSGKKRAAFSRILGQDVYYDEQTHKETEAKAQQLISDMGVQEAVKLALTTSRPTAETMRVIYYELERLNGLVDMYAAEGKLEEMNAVADQAGTLAAQIVQRQVEIGQATEIAKTLEPLSPEAALITATKMVQYAKGDPTAQLSERQNKQVIKLSRDLRAANQKLAESRIKLANAQRKIKRLEDDKPPKERKSTSTQEKLLKDYQAKKKDILAQLRDQFPTSSMFKGDATTSDETLKSSVVPEIDPKTRQLLTDYSVGQILSGKSPTVLFEELSEITGLPVSDSILREIQAAAVDVVKPASKPQSAEAKARIKVRSEHYQAADKWNNRFDDAIKNLKSDIDKSEKQLTRELESLGKKLDKSDSEFTKAEDKAKKDAEKRKAKYEAKIKQFEAKEQARLDRIAAPSKEAQYAEEQDAYKDNPEMLYAIDRLTKNRPGVMTSTNAVIKDIQTAFGVPLETAGQIAQQAKEAVGKIRKDIRREIDEAKGISVEERAAITEQKKVQAKARYQLNRFLSNISQRPTLIKRFNNDFRAKLVSNWGTQLFNAVQAGVVTMPVETILLDGLESGLRTAGLNMGAEGENIRLKDLMLPYAYVAGYNRQAAEGVLAEFPESYFKVYSGLMGDIDVEGQRLADDTNNPASFAAHWWFDRQDQLNNKLAQISGAKMQELHFRNAIVGANIDQVIRAKTKGEVNLKQAAESGELLKYITENDVKRAVSKAMSVTFASEIDDPVGKWLKQTYDKMDSYWPVLLNPVTFARFTYTATKNMVANPLLLGALDAKRLGGKGYDSRSIAKGIVAYGGVSAAYALMSAFGGDDDKWETLYVFGKDNPPLNIKRFYPVSAYFYVAHLIKNWKEGRPNPEAKELAEGFASLETDYFAYGAPVELLSNTGKAVYGSKDWSAVGGSSAAVAGNYFAGMLRFIKPLKDALAQMDASDILPTGESKMKEFGDDAGGKFLKEVSKTLPLIAKLSDAPYRKDAVTGEEIKAPFPIGRMVGLNLVHPSFIAKQDTVATEWANRLFKYQGGGEMSAEERKAYQVRKQLREAVWSGKVKNVDDKIDAFVADGTLTKPSADRLKKDLKLSELQVKIKANLSLNKMAEVADLKKIWDRATEEERADIAAIVDKKIKGLKSDKNAPSVVNAKNLIKGYTGKRAVAGDEEKQ